MVGIIVMTHGTLSEGIVDAAELITGPVTQVETLSLRREDNVNDLNAAFLAALDRVDTGDGVLVLADLLGGSPCNVASMNLRERSYRVLSGVNLPMFIGWSTWAWSPLAATSRPTESLPRSSPCPSPSRPA